MVACTSTTAYCRFALCIARAALRARKSRRKTAKQMTDLRDPKWMYAKAAMFLVIGTMAFWLLLLPQELWTRVILQLLMIWAFARLYYFAFYVIEHYVDSAYRFSGLVDFLKYMAGTRRKAGQG